MRYQDKGGVGEKPKVPRPKIMPGPQPQSYEEPKKIEIHIYIHESLLTKVWRRVKELF